MTKQLEKVVYSQNYGKLISAFISYIVYKFNVTFEKGSFSRVNG